MNEEGNRMYADKLSNDEWEMKIYESDFYDQDIYILEKKPSLTIEGMIELALQTKEIQLIIALSIEFYYREKEFNEKYKDKLLNAIERQIKFINLTPFEKERYKILIYEAKIFDSTNRTSIVGKTIAQIKIDAEYYKGVSTRALAILEKVEN